MPEAPPCTSAVQAAASFSSESGSAGARHVPCSVVCMRSRSRRPVILVLLLPLLPLAACEDDLPVPEVHREVAVSCDRERPPGNVARVGSYGPGECTSDADCTAQENGRCQVNRGSAFCNYDTCFSDATCTTGGPCECDDEYGFRGNACLPGNCQTDTDCGSGRYCSPTLGSCGDYGGIVGYYCHTAKDVCTDDSRCYDQERGGGYCMYKPEVGHWACGYGQCVG